MGRLVHTVNPNRILPIRKPAYLSSRPGVNDVMKTKIYLALKYSYYGERRSYLVIRILKVGYYPPTVQPRKYASNGCDYSSRFLLRTFLSMDWELSYDDSEPELETPAAAL